MSTERLIEATLTLQMLRDLLKRALQEGADREGRVREAVKLIDDTLIAWSERPQPTDEPAPDRDKGYRSGKLYEPPWDGDK